MEMLKIKVLSGPTSRRNSTNGNEFCTWRAITSSSSIVNIAASKPHELLRVGEFALLLRYGVRPGATAQELTSINISGNTKVSFFLDYQVIIFYV
jgi:hypothetical protein